MFISFIVTHIDAFYRSAVRHSNIWKMCFRGSDYNGSNSRPVGNLTTHIRSSRWRQKHWLCVFKEGFFVIIFFSIKVWKLYRRNSKVTFSYIAPLYDDGNSILRRRGEIIVENSVIRRISVLCVNAPVGLTELF